MRRVIVSMNVTLDGFMAGAKGELDWHFPLWNKEMSSYACEQLHDVDTILLGRVSYQTMARYWPYAAFYLTGTSDDIEFAHMMNNHNKIVFSKTLEKVEWNNSRLIRDNIQEEISLLKQQRGKDMIIYGSGSIVQTFTRLGLIDEYRIWMHPVVITRGKSLFKSVRNNLNLKLTQTRTFSSGVVLLHYQTN
jgi:dihydrofolate reductase